MKVQMHWGETIEIECGMPEHPVVVDGEQTPFQSADFSCDTWETIEGVIKLLGPDWYGHDDGDLEAAIEGAEILDEEEEDEA